MIILTLIDEEVYWSPDAENMTYTMLPFRGHVLFDTKVTVSMMRYTWKLAFKIYFLKTV
jgi:hypothetical protein